MSEQYTCPEIRDGERGKDGAVEIARNENGRFVVRAFNEGGYNCTDVDVLDLIAWIKANKPEWLTQGG